MTPLERLLAEELPTGEFGGPRTGTDPRPKRIQPRRQTTAIEAAEHHRALQAALDQREGRGTGRPERHLRPVPAHRTHTRKAS